MRAIGLLLSAALLAVGAAPVRLGQAAASVRWAVQMQVVSSYETTGMIAHAPAGAYCWASVQYATGTIGSIALQARIVGPSGLLAWSWEEQKANGLAAVQCSWRHTMRSASANFGLPATVVVPSNGIPPVQIPPGAHVLLQWNGGTYLSPAFIVKGPFTLLAALAPQTPGLPSYVLAVRVFGKGVASSGAINVNTLTNQTYRFSGVDCSGGCRLNIVDATNLTATLVITQ